MVFAKRVFAFAALWGVLILVPLYFMEEVNARLDPPALNHPEYYYGFVSVALVWQSAYFLCGRDPVRFRPFMLLCAAAKGSWVVTATVLFLANRCSGTLAASCLPDAILGVLFVVAFLKTEPG